MGTSCDVDIERPTMAEVQDSPSLNKGSSSSSAAPDMVKDGFQLTDNVDDIDDFNHGVSIATSAASVRLGFIRKVYGILSCQLLVTGLAIAIVCLVEPIRVAVQQMEALFYIALFAPLVLIFCLIMNRHNYPMNMYLLAAFTLCEAFTLSVVCSHIEFSIVLEAVVITGIIFGSLTAYTFQSKRDFHFLGAGLYTCLMVLFVGGLMQIFFPFAGALQLLWGMFGALVFSLYIVYDTWKLSKVYGPDEYIVASIELYLDLVNLFLYILQILKHLQDN